MITVSGLEIRRFVKNASSNIKSNTMCREMMDSNYTTLTSGLVPWIETADTDASLAVNDPTKSVNGSKYDAFVQSGDAVKDSGTQRAYAGMALYRVQLPNNSHPKAVSLSVSSDKYNVWGSIVSVFLSDTAIDNNSSYIDTLKNGGYYLNNTWHALFQYGKFEDGIWKPDSSKSNWNGEGFNTNDVHSIESGARRAANKGILSANTSLSTATDQYKNFEIKCDVTKLDSNITYNDLTKFKYLYIMIRLFNYQDNYRQYYIEGSTAINVDTIKVMFDDQSIGFSGTYDGYKITPIPRNETIDGKTYTTYSESIKIPATNSNDRFKALGIGALTKPGMYTNTNGIGKMCDIIGVSTLMDANAGICWGVHRTSGDLTLGVARCVLPMNNLLNKYLHMNFYCRAYNTSWSEGKTLDKTHKFRVVAIGLPTPDYEIDYGDSTILDGSNPLCIASGEFDTSNIMLNPDYTPPAEGESDNLRNKYIIWCNLKFKKNNTNYYVAFLCIPVELNPEITEPCIICNNNYNSELCIDLRA